MSLRALVLLVALGLVVTGCSSVGLGYRYADWLMLRHMDRLLNLDDGQRVEARRRLAQALETHRREELPEVLATLRETRNEVSSGLDRERIDHLFDRGRALYRASATRFLPAAAATLAGLQPAQIDFLERRLAERNERYVARFIEPPGDQRRERRGEQAVERIEPWTGRLSTAQRRLVAAGRAAMPDAARSWLAYRQGREAGLLSLLRAGAGQADVEGYLAAWILELHGRPAALEVTLDAQVEAWKELLLDLDRRLEPGQRERVVERLEGWIRSLERQAAT
jgi:hypothetical protein